MKKDSLQYRLSRRSLLLRSVHCAAGILLTNALPGYARPVADSRISLYHTHTGERLTIDPLNNFSETSNQVNRFLRDFRTGDVHPIDPQLVEMLYQIKTLAQSRGTFEIISGYRSPQTNAMLRNNSTGVAKKSHHMTGSALDIRLTYLETSKLRDIAQSLKRGGVGYYPKSDFVHIDTGRVRYW